MPSITPVPLCSACVPMPIRTSRSCTNSPSRNIQRSPRSGSADVCWPAIRVLIAQPPRRDRISWLLPRRAPGELLPAPPGPGEAGLPAGGELLQRTVLVAPLSAQVAREVGDRRLLEQGVDGDVAPDVLRDPLLHRDQHQRVAAEVEEAL